LIRAVYWRAEDEGAGGNALKRLAYVLDRRLPQGHAERLEEAFRRHREITPRHHAPQRGNPRLDELAVAPR
jgi:hypothetical protein